MKKCQILVNLVKILTINEETTFFLISKHVFLVAMNTAIFPKSIRFADLWLWHFALVAARVNKECEPK